MSIIPGLKLEGMMDRAARKAVQAAWREREVEAGIFAFRGSERVWVGASRTLDAAENRVRFQLRMGACRTPGLQAAWAAAGDVAFRYEVVERFDPELSEMARAGLLKERTAHWRERLGGRPI
jgi:hypothetical protein